MSFREPIRQLIDGTGQLTLLIESEVGGLDNPTPCLGFDASSIHETPDGFDPSTGLVIQR